MSPDWYCIFCWNFFYYWLRLVLYILLEFLLLLAQIGTVYLVGIFLLLAQIGTVYLAGISFIIGSDWYCISCWNFFYYWLRLVLYILLKNCYIINIHIFHSMENWQLHLNIMLLTHKYITTSLIINLIGFHIIISYFYPFSFTQLLTSVNCQQTVIYTIRLSGHLPNACSTWSCYLWILKLVMD